MRRGPVESERRQRPFRRFGVTHTHTRDGELFLLSRPGGAPKKIFERNLFGLLHSVDLDSLANTRKFANLAHFIRFLAGCAVDDLPQEGWVNRKEAGLR
jgi:hypothetical protein